MTLTHKDLLRERLTSLKLPEELARKLGLSSDIEGIRIFYQDKEGNQVYYTRKNRTTVTDADDKQVYFRKRFNDELAKEKGYKYKTERGTDPLFYYNAFKQLPHRGNTLFLTEGEFKAIAITHLCKLPAIAFPGITVNNITSDLEEVLLNYDNVVVLYDKDATDVSTEECGIVTIDESTEELDLIIQTNFNGEGEIVTRDVSTEGEIVTTDTSTNKGGIVTTKRSIQFYNSISRFAKQFFAIQVKHCRNSNLYFAQVAPGQDKKGIDDLIQAKGEDAILPALKSLKDSDYLTFIKLSKTTFESKLKDHFGLTTHEQFYQKHQAVIQDNIFSFAGTYYRYTGTYFELDDPHDIKLTGTIHLKIEKYLSEVKDDIVGNLNSYTTVLQAPTGAGKTTLIKSLQGKKIIAVHTINLAYQLAGINNKIAIVGGVSQKAIEEALKEDMIICLWDMLPRIYREISDCTLVIDEAHNLVKQYNFRASTINYILNLIEKQVPEKVLLLTATPNSLFSLVHQAKTIQVDRLQNNSIEVQKVIAANSGTRAIIKAVTSCIDDMDKDKVNFVYYNSRKQLEVIKKHLVTKKGWLPDDIAIISRDHIEIQDREYLDIIEKERIIGAKLILTTCLIAEGVNIKNKNIGRIVTVNLYCPDTFRQFTARFREVDKLEVFDIKAPESVLMPDFYKTPTKRYKDKHDRAEADRQKIAKDQADVLSTLSEDELLFLGIALESTGAKRSKTRPYIVSEQGAVRVDKTAIIHDIEKELIEEANNAYFYTKIAKYAGVYIAEGTQDKHDQEELQAIAESQDAAKSDQEELQAKLIEDLKQRPEAVIGAYFIHCDKTSNRNGMNFINDYCPELNNDHDYNFYNANKHILADAELTELIRHYCKRHWIKLPKNDLFEFLDNYNKTKARSEWNAFVQQYKANVIYPKKHYRQGMDPVDRSEVKDFISIKEKVGSGVVTIKKVQSIIKSITGEFKSDRKCIELLKVVFRVQVHQEVFKIDRYDRYKDNFGRWVRVDDIQSLPDDKNLKVGIVAKSEKMLILEEYDTIYPSAEIWQNVKAFTRVML